MLLSTFWCFESISRKIEASVRSIFSWYNHNYYFDLILLWKIEYHPWTIASIAFLNENCQKYSLGKHLGELISTKDTHQILSAKSSLILEYNYLNAYIIPDLSTSYHWNYFQKLNLCCKYSYFNKFDIFLANTPKCSWCGWRYSWS